MILLLLAFWVAELNGLDAPGPYPKYAEKLELFGQLVSVWNVEVTYHRSDGTRDTAATKNFGRPVSVTTYPTRHYDVRYRDAHRCLRA